MSSPNVAVLDGPDAAPSVSNEAKARVEHVGFASTTHDPRAVIASAWQDDPRPEHVAFREWTERYLASDTGPARDALLADGLRAAGARGVALARLITEDPEAALASAVPMRIREALPANIVAKLEKRISGRGELTLNAVTPAPGGPAPAESSFRTALVGGAEYRAYVYGRRSTQATTLDAALNGIAIDRVFAVAESPVRILETGERPEPSAPALSTCAACAAAWSGADASPQTIRYEYAGTFGAAENSVHFQEDAALLETADRDLTAADNQPGTYTVVGRPSKVWTHGQKKLLIVLVDFPDLQGRPQNLGPDTEITDDLAAELFSKEGGVGDFYLASSFGKTSLAIRPAVGGDSPDVTPVLRLPRSATDYAVNGDSNSLHADARAAALAAGFDPAAYERVGVVFSNLSSRVETSSGKTSKITYGGLATIIGPNFWVNGFYNFRVVAHELGHTYGLRHANLWEVSDGDPVSDTGRSLEYGDPFDLMGGGEDFTSKDDFGPWNKSILQWIPDTAVTVAGTEGTYRVHAFDSAGADLSLPRALKIVRDPTRDYWIGYRRGTDNASLDGGLYVVWGYNSNKQGDLLDLSTPGSDPSDAALPIGATLDDAAAGITITPVLQGGSGADEWVDIQVAVRPRVQWVSTQVLAAEQGAVATLAARRIGSSAGPLSVSYATENGTALAPSDYASVSGTISWADGETADKTITVPLVADGIVEHSESFTVRLGIVSGGVRVGPADATVTIAEVGASDATFRSDFISATVNRILPLPDGSIIAGGPFTILQDSAFSTYRNVGRIARFKPDGTLDVDFDRVAGANGTVRALALQADGGILVGGEFTAYAGAPAGGIVRIFPDGSLDSSFNPGTGANKIVHDIVVQPDGRILVAGTFDKFNGVSRNRVVRLNPDGQIDGSFANPTFSATVLRSLALQPDGKVLVAGGLSYSGLSGEGFKSGVARLNTNGSRDTAFDVGFGAHTSAATNKLTTVFRVAVQADGRIIAVGDFTGFGGFKGSARRHIARLSASGAVDTGFAPRPSLESDPASTSVVALRLLPGNRLLVGGAFTKIGAIECGRLALIDENGSVDAAFAAAGGHGGTVTDFALLPDGKVLLAGDPRSFQDSTLERPLWRVIPGLSGAPGTVAFSEDTYSGREGGAAVLTVRRVGGSLGQVRVAYAAARDKTSDTATPGADYTLSAGTLSWADGDDSERTIIIPLVKDNVDDAGEVFTVRLGDPVLGGASLGARREVSVSIEAFDPRAQTITFDALEDSAVGSPVSLVATSSSGRTVAFELVSGLASLSGATITPTAIGAITVRAVQAGDVDFDPAPPVERSFGAFIPASVTLTNLSQTYAAAPRPVGFTSTPSGIAATITYAGSLTAPSAVGDYAVALEVIEPFVSGSAAGTLTISKAPLAVRPDDQRRLVGSANAPITLGYVGFQGGESATEIDKPPVAKTAATKSSKPGEYPITLSGGSDNNYSFNFTPGVIRVVGFGSAYETLLTPPGGGAPLGKLALTVSATAPTFTGLLDLGEEPSPITIKGGRLTLDPPPEGDEEDSATGSWSSTAVAPRNYRTEFSITASAFIVTVYRGSEIIAEGGGPRVFVPPAKTSVTWTGAYTAWLDALERIDPDDARPLPPGAGHAVFFVPASGAFTFAGGLPDGSKFSAPLKPDAGGGYRFFARPQGKRAGSFIAGQLDVGGRTAKSFVWKSGGGATANLRAGFALDGLVSVASWQAPKSATRTTMAVTLRDVLGLSAETGALSAGFSGADLGENVATIPGALSVTTVGKVTLDPASTPNPRKFALKIVPKTGAFSGSFVLLDKRKVTFSGALRSPSVDDAAEPVDIGLGFFIVPTPTKGGESMPGAIRLATPSPVPAP